MRRWVSVGAVLFVAWMGYGASCVDSGPIEQGAVQQDAGDSVPVAPGTLDGGGVAGLPDAGATSSDHQRGTVTSGLDITEFRSVIFRTDGSSEDVGDSELFLAAGNRAVIYLTVKNASDGWVPVNFELCIDHADALAAIDPSAPEPEHGDVLEDPCVVRYEDGQWPNVEQGQALEIRAGAVVAKPQASGGYITIYFRADFADIGVLDLFEYTVPYRVLPP